MILELDIGNTRIKWRVTGPDGAVNAAGMADTLQQLVDQTVRAYSLQRVRIACVRAGQFMPDFVRHLREQWGLTAEVARVLRECQGVTVGYSDPQKLGVDRWLTLLAAHRDAAGAAIIVDCGTALTIDLIEAGGRHLGGYIVPGFRLGPDALTRNTAIRLAARPDWSLEPGNSSEDAIYHGTLVMLTALLEKVVARELPQLSAQAVPVLYLTGGDAPLIKRFLKTDGVEIREVPSLVFDGLGLALP